MNKDKTMLEAVNWKDHLKEMRDPVWLSFDFCNNLRSQANRVLPIAMLLSPVTSVDLKCLRVKPNTAAPTHHHRAILGTIGQQPLSLNLA